MILIQPEEVNPLLNRAAKLLSTYMNTPVVLESPQIIKNWERNCILRCQIQGALGCNCSSVIIKQLKQDQTCGYSDWAGLQFVSGLQSRVQIAPQVYGGDTELAFFIMEDLGPSRTMDDILQGTDDDAATIYFIDLVTKMASLHNLTLDQEGAYRTLRGALPMDDNHGRVFESARWNEGLQRVHAWFRALDCPLPSAVDPCFAIINNTFANPGRFLTFTHGDMAPSNNHITDDQVYLLDFEYGDFRHALYDLTAWYMLCPLPETLVQRLINHYSKEICPAILGSDETFEANWNLICAWRGLALLSWIPQGIIQENRPWVGEWSMREAVLITLHRLHTVCSRVHELLPLAEHVGILSQRLQAQWSEYSIETCLPRWSVFQRQPPSR